MGDAADRRVVADLRSDIDTIDGVDPVDRSDPTPGVTVPPPEFAPVEPPVLTPIDRRRYKLGHEIAKGGMGRVLEACDLRLGRTVAIKELLPKNRHLAERFEREARITARLQHPAIIHVYEAGVWPGGEPFYAMPKVSGRSFDKVIGECATLAERLALVPNVIAVADALAYAHSEHVIHRDLKPANVLVGAFGETVVIDWGLAKDQGVPLDPMQSLQLRTRPAADQTHDGEVVGTPAYMPPEQARGASVDQRADVYALGALLYHVLVGSPPYVGASSKDVLAQVKRGPCVPVREREPGAPTDLIMIVAKAMARDRGERYADAGEFAHDLRRFQNGQLITARHYSTAHRLGRWIVRHRVPVAIGVAAVSALAIVGVVSVSRILAEQQNVQRRRDVLLEERGRVDLLEGQAGRALAYLVGVAGDRAIGRAGAFMIADAIRGFEAEIARFPVMGAVAFSPDGRHIATGTAEGGIQLWDLRGRALAWFSGGHGAPTRLTFDRAGTRLCVADGDGVVRVYPIAGGPPRALGRPGAPVLDLDTSPDDALLATGDAEGRVAVYELDTGRAVWSASCRDDEDPQAPPGALAVRFGPDGAEVAASTDHLICRFDASGRGVPTLLRGHTARINSIRWSPDGRFVLSASDDGTARLWEERGKSVLVLEHDGGAAVTSAELSPDGRMIATAGADRIARVWEVPTGSALDDPTTRARERWKLVGHHAAIDRVVFAPDGRQLATASRDGKAKLWDAETGQMRATFEHAWPVFELAFGPGDRLFTAAQDGARIWDLARTAALRSYEVDTAVHALAVTADGTLAAGGDDTKVRLWRAAAGGLPPPDDDPIVLRDHMGRVTAVAFSPDGTRLISAGEDADALVWDVATGAARGRLGPHDGTVRAVAVAPDGETIATAGDDGVVRLWSARTGALLERRPCGRELRALAWSPDGTLLVAVGGDGALIRWRPGLPPAVLAVHDAVAVAFRPDGRLLAIATSGELALYEIVSGEIAAAPARVVDGPIGDVRALAFGRDGALLLTANGDGVIRVWDPAKGKLIGTREGAGPALDAIAVTGDGRAVWVAGAGATIRAWDIRVDTRSTAELERFLAAHVPWRLDQDDVVRSTAQPR